MKTLKLLFVEDDEIARENACEYLEEYFETIYEAKDGLEALSIYKQYKPDIIITDIQMPKISGLELVETIRKTDLETQIIITSAYSTKEYLLKAVELGLVKYLIKPINEKDLLGALKSCSQSLKKNASINLKDEYIYDKYNKTLMYKDEVIKLRAKELLLLELLIKNHARYLTYSEIEHYVWSDDVMSKDAIKTLIKNLKNKLPKDSILNLSGTGYKIDI